MWQPTAEDFAKADSASATRRRIVAPVAVLLAGRLAALAAQPARARFRSCIVVALAAVHGRGPLGLARRSGGAGRRPDQPARRALRGERADRRAVHAVGRRHAADAADRGLAARHRPAARGARDDAEPCGSSGTPRASATGYHVYRNISTRQPGRALGLPLAEMLDPHRVSFEDRFDLDAMPLLVFGRRARCATASKRTTTRVLDGRAGARHQRGGSRGARLDLEPRVRCASATR